MRLATRDYARPQRPKNPPPRGRAQPRKASAKRGGHAGAALGLPLWAWMVVSFSLIVFGAALYYVSRPVAPMDMVPSSNAKAAKGAAKAVVIPPKEPSRFGFYEMLPSYEVVVPEEVLNPTKPKPGSNANNLPQAAAIALPPANPRDTATASVAERQPDVGVKPSTAATATVREIAPATAPPQPTAQLAKGEQFLIQVAAFRTRADAEQRLAALTLAGLSARVEQITIDNRNTWFRVRLGPYGSASAAASAQQTLKLLGYAGVVIKVRN